MACSGNCSLSNELTSLFNIKHPILYVTMRLGYSTYAYTLSLKDWLA
jgi:hypothetical protein